LFRNNIWKLYRLSGNIVSDIRPQFAAEMIQEVNKMLRIEMKLSIAFHSQIDE